MSRFFLLLLLLCVFFAIGLIFGLTLHSEHEDEAKQVQVSSFETVQVQETDVSQTEQAIENSHVITDDPSYPIVKTASFLEKTVVFINEKIIQLLYSFANLFF